MGDIVDRSWPTEKDDNGKYQQHCPQAKDHLDFAQEVHQACSVRNGSSLDLTPLPFQLVPMLQAMSRRGELGAEEGVKHSEKKDQSADEIERICGDSCSQSLEDGASSVVITR